MYGHVTPFLKSIKTSLSNCSLRDETTNLMKYAYRILLEVIFRCSGENIPTKIVFNVSSEMFRSLKILFHHIS